MNPTTIDVPGLPPANTTYSQVSILGDLVFVSGQVGIDPATGRLADGGIQAQTRHAIESIDRCLAAAGASLDKVAKVNLYVADFGNPAQGDQGRLLSLRAELLPALPPGGSASADDRHRDLPHRLSLCETRKQ